MGVSERFCALLSAVVARWQRHQQALAAVMLLINVGLLAGYIVYGYPLHFHSDSAIRVLLADEMVRAGSLLPPDWYFVNGDLWLMRSQWFVLPILWFLPPGYTAFALAGCVTAALLLAALWYLLGALTDNVTRKLWTMAAVAAGLSGLVAEGLFGQAAYSLIIAAIAFLTAVTAKGAAGRAVATKWLVLAGLLAAALTATNPLRAMIFCHAPLLFAVVTHSVIEFSRRAQAISRGEQPAPVNRALLAVMACLAGGIALGLLGRQWALSDVVINPGVLSDYFQRTPAESLDASFTQLLTGVLALLGGRVTAGPVLDALGLYELIRFFAALLVLALLPLALRSAFNGVDTARRVAAFVALGCSLSTGFFVFATNLIGMSPDIEGVRYLLPAATLLVLVLLTLPMQQPLSEGGGTSAVSRLCVVAIIAVYVSGAPANLYIADHVSKLRPEVLATRLAGVANTPLDMARMSAAPLAQQPLGQPTQALTRLLEAQNLHYGYASYWFANATTVFSNGEIKVRPVEFRAGLPMPRFWQSAGHWYDEEAWQGESFLALTPAELALIDLTELAARGLIVERRVSAAGFDVLVFTENPAAVLPEWRERPFR